MLRAKTFDLAALERIADWLAVGVAASLPWSTSATGILVAMWLIALLPTLNWDFVRRELGIAPGCLPVLLWLFGAIGMLWADVPWSERIGALGAFHRLLMIPLLLAQFRRSDRGIWVLYGFFASSVLLLMTSLGLALLPGLPWRGRSFGVPVKDYVLQGEIFLICAFALIDRALGYGRAREWHLAFGLAALATLFLANILFVATGRTALLVPPVLVLLFGTRQAGWKGFVTTGVVGGILFTAVWFASPYLRDRLETSVVQFQAYRASDEDNATGEHLEFLKKSLQIIATAPVIGHGTGSIPEQLRRVVVGRTGTSSLAPGNPHNQTFAVAIQLGVLGAAVL